MKNFWKMLGDVEMFSAVFGWLIFSLVTMMILSFIFLVLGVDFFNNLLRETKIIASLILGYCVWYPYWDKRKR